MQVMSRHEELRKECEAFHAAHPEVWSLFITFTLEAVRTGREHFGVGAVWERLRWETQVNPRYQEMGELKLNNNYRAFYARRFARLFPKYKDFFRFRKQPSKDS